MQQLGGMGGGGMGGLGDLAKLAGKFKGFQTLEEKKSVREKETF